MPVGFLPLASSVISSEPDIEAPRQALKSIRNQPAFGTAARARPPQSSKFSFLKPNLGKRARIDGAQLISTMSSRESSFLSHHQNVIEKSLLQPVDLNSAPKAPSLTFEEIESILSPLCNYSDNAPQDINRVDGLSTLGSEQHPPSDFWLFDDLGGSENDRVSPFFGAFSHNTENFVATPRNEHPVGSPFVSVFDLFQRKSDGAPERSIQVKVIPSSTKPLRVNPITPNFSRTIAAKAVQSKDRARDERLQYNRFLKKLCADGKDHLKPGLGRKYLEILDESEDDEDDVFDIFGNAGNESDDGSAEFYQEEPKSIPNRELLELFAAEAEVKSKIDYGARRMDSDVTIYFTPANYDVDFQKEISRQVNVHFQLLVQTLALAGELKGADQVWIRLDDRIDRGGQIREKINYEGGSGLKLLLRILQQSALHEQLINSIRATSNDPDLRLRASIKNIPFKPKHKGGKVDTFSKSFWHILSIFNNPHDKRFALIPRDAGNLTLIFDLNESLIGYDLVDHQIIKHEVNCLPGRRGDSFLPIEDRLLLLGLHRYGLANWEKIQVHLVPTRTAKQLANRYKNLATRRAPDNPIKWFAAEAMRPLSKIEEELLFQGFRTYGYDWSSISHHFLPHRPASILQKIWAKHHPESTRILDAYFPSDDGEDSEYQQE